jgi:copper chaperone CopZ
MLCQVEEGKVAGPSKEPSGYIVCEEEVPPPTPEHGGPYDLLLSVGGMTCAACTSTVTRLLSEIGGVSNVAVDLIGHSAKLTIEEKNLVEVVVETIEDSGYDADVVKTQPCSNKTVDGNLVAPRAISLRVDGMFCQ